MSDFQVSVKEVDDVVVIATMVTLITLVEKRFRRYVMNIWTKGLINF